MGRDEKRVPMALDEGILGRAMDIGEEMLICGAEVHRVEDSLKRIFAAYGAKRTDVFIITSSMVVTVQGQNGEIFTETRRIFETAIDYEKLHQLNELSRYICRSRAESDEIGRRLQTLKSGPRYPLWLEFICYAVIAGAFTLFFGGGMVEALVSLFAGALVRFVILLCDKSVKNRIFVKFISAFSATVIAYLALVLHFVPTVDYIIIGNIMSLIPGVGLTTALKDLLVGDSIAGLLRTIEACITALAIAAGYFLVAILFGGGAIA